MNIIENIDKPNHSKENLSQKKATFTYFAKESRIIARLLKTQMYEQLSEPPT
jgi:hypothetical protein